MSGHKRTVAVVDRADAFWPKVQKSEGCWLWTGKKNPRHKYGQFYVGWDGKRYREWRAHRVAWVLSNGPLAEGMDVLHSCDNPLCVRPEHLFVGNKSANMADAAQKGRLHWQKWKAEADRVRGLFTREDVELLERLQPYQTPLEKALNNEWGAGDIEVRMTRETAAQFANLASRIEALLPPRPDTEER